MSEVELITKKKKSSLFWRYKDQTVWHGPRSSVRAPRGRPLIKHSIMVGATGEGETTVGDRRLFLNSNLSPSIYTDVNIQPL